MTASKSEIKQAWKDLLIIWHPDKHHENERRRKLAEEKTKEINEAYEIAYKYDCRRDQQQQSRYQNEQKNKLLTQRKRRQASENQKAIKGDRRSKPLTQKLMNFLGLTLQ